MAESTPADGRVCSKCGERKPLEEFQVRRDGAGDGRRRDCRACCAARVRAWQAADAARRGVIPRVRAPKGCRTCEKCAEVRPLDEFKYDNGRRRNHCAQCAPAVERKKFLALPHGLKWCTKCSECKPLDAFPRSNRGRHGSWCKACVARHNREQYKRPEIRADRRARWDSWHAENPNWAARWRAANLERARENVRRHQARRRARLRGLPAEAYTLEQLLERDGTLCVLCDDELDLEAAYPDPLSVTVEHLECISWPDSAGDVPSNVALSHFRCNCERSDRPHPAAARKRAELLAAEQQPA